MEMLAGKTQRLEKKDAVLEKKDAMLTNEVKQSRNKIKRLEKKDTIVQNNTAEINSLKQTTNKTNHFLAILKQNNKQKQRRLGDGGSPLTNELCPVVTMKDVLEYQKDLDLFCTGYAHICLLYTSDAADE